MFLWPTQDYTWPEEVVSKLKLQFRTCHLEGGSSVVYFCYILRLNASLNLLCLVGCRYFSLLFGPVLLATDTSNYYI